MHQFFYQLINKNSIINSIEQFITLYAFTFYNFYNQFFETATIENNIFYFEIKLHYLYEHYMSNKNFSNYFPFYNFLR